MIKQSWCRCTETYAGLLMQSLNIERRKLQMTDDRFEGLVNKTTLFVLIKILKIGCRLDQNSMVLPQIYPFVKSAA